MVGTSLSQPGCGSLLQPAFGTAYAMPVASSSKSQAILGGQISRLEMISLQQHSVSVTGIATAPALAMTTPGANAGSTNCAQLALPTAINFAVAPGVQSRPASPEDFLASKRLSVRRTAFDAQWQRVSHGGLSRRLVATLGQNMPGGGSRANLAAINSWTNARVRFVEDRVQYGRADYWATAQSTLRRRAGDCEDIAIAKLQLLAAVGVPRANMYLTIARDLVRNADHAMLVVRLDDKFWLLDNATDELLDASKSYDYRPILSYSDSGKWLHGY